MNTGKVFFRHTRVVAYRNLTTCLSQTKSQPGVEGLGTKPNPWLLLGQRESSFFKDVTLSKMTILQWKATLPRAYRQRDSQHKSDWVGLYLNS